MRRLLLYISSLCASPPRAEETQVALPALHSAAKPCSLGEEWPVAPRDLGAGAVGRSRWSTRQRDWGGLRAFRPLPLKSMS